MTRPLSVKPAFSSTRKDAAFHRRTVDQSRARPDARALDHGVRCLRREPRAVHLAEQLEGHLGLVHGCAADDEAAVADRSRLVPALDREQADPRPERLLGLHREAVAHLLARRAALIVEASPRGVAGIALGPEAVDDVDVRRAQRPHP